jgi:hypothetical protein
VGPRAGLGAVVKRRWPIRVHLKKLGSYKQCWQYSRVLHYKEANSHSLILQLNVCVYDHVEGKRKAGIQTNVCVLAANGINFLTFHKRSSFWETNYRSCIKGMHFFQPS